MRARLALVAFLGPVAIGVLTGVMKGESSVSGDSILRQTFDLGGQRSQQAQYYLMESRLIYYALDGARTGTDVYRLRLKCVPAKLAGKEGDEYTCVQFTFQQGEAAETLIPALAGWSYVFKRTETGMDEKGQVLSIEHSKFENLVDGNGKAIPPDKSYQIYNTFIDFHSFCNIFAEKTPSGRGIQDLKWIGQKIVHAAAFTEPPVNLGSNVSEGSTFKNGEITLELKGLSLVNEAPCAVVGYDSGESHFKMIMNLLPNMEIRSVGSSHYMGDIYIDLATNWVQKATLDEFVVAETTLPIAPNKMNSVIERHSLIRNVSKEEFTQKELR